MWEAGGTGANANTQYKNSVRAAREGCRNIKSALEQEYATPDLFTMGHWHGEISSNATFAYGTKCCIGVVVLRGRPLAHVRNLSMKPKPFYRAFSFFFLHEKSQRGCIRVRKLGDIKADTHS